MPDRTLIVFTGIPATGKTTVLNEALRVCPYVKVINYGEAMLKTAGWKESERDLMRKLPIRDQLEIGMRAAKEIVEQTKGVVLLDTHAVIKTPVGFICGLPRGILEILQPNAIATVEADPQVIYDRRRKDKSRKRDNETVQEIFYHQQLNRAMIASCCTMVCAVFAPIDNNGEALHGAEQLVQLIKFLHREQL